MLSANVALLRAIGVSVIFNVAPFAPTHAMAQTAPITATNFNVAGVKLGMTPDEAVAALKAYDASLKIVDQTKNPPSADGGVMDAQFTILAESSDFALAAEARKQADAAKDACEKAHPYVPGLSPMPAIEKCGADAEAIYQPNLVKLANSPEAIIVQFSPVPGNVKVISVARSIFFAKSVPTVANAVLSLKQKYSAPPSVTIDQKTLVWKFDPHMRLAAKLPPNEVPDLVRSDSNLFRCETFPLCSYPKMPRMMSTHQGIQLIAAVKGNAVMNGSVIGGAVTDNGFVPVNGGADTRNPLLASQMDIVLFDGGALARRGGQLEKYTAWVAAQKSQAGVAGNSNVPKL